MKAIIHEMLITDEGIRQGDKYEVIDLNEELERLDRKGMIFSVSGSFPNRKRKCMEIILSIYI